MKSSPLLRSLAVIFCASTLLVAKASTPLSPQGRQAHPKPDKHPPCALTPPASFSMFVPLSHAKYFGGGDIMLNNRGIIDHEVVPTWYVQGRGLMVGPSVTLPASQAGFYAIETLLPPHVSFATVDGLELSYVGKQREVWAQVSLRPQHGAQPTQSLDAPFNMKGDFKSNRLETVWPAVRHTEHAVVALVNTTDETLMVP